MYLVTWRWPGSGLEHTATFISPRDEAGVRYYWLVNGFGREVVDVRDMSAQDAD